MDFYDNLFSKVSDSLSIMSSNAETKLELGEDLERDPANGDRLESERVSDLEQKDSKQVSRKSK